MTREDLKWPLTGETITISKSRLAEIALARQDQARKAQADFDALLWKSLWPPTEQEGDEP